MSLSISEKATPVGRSRRRRVVNSAADIVMAIKERRRKICEIAVVIAGLMILVFGSMTLITNIAKFNPGAKLANTPVVTNEQVSGTESDHITKQDSADTSSGQKTESADSDALNSDTANNVDNTTISSTQTYTAMQQAASPASTNSTNNMTNTNNSSTSSTSSATNTTTQPNVDSNQEQTTHVDWCEQELPQIYMDYRAGVEVQKQEYLKHEIGKELYQQNTTVLWVQFTVEAEAHGCDINFYTQ